ncbi:uncharacterized protein [Nicotiana sylvestris]|uniref:uncharacterized protein n=1 Tax=Nicotiana sylvestris TaxID=4096 RepID=UPI00388C855D
MARETGSEISFQEAANVARRMEMVLSQGSGHGSDKRPRHSGRFSGSSFESRDSYGRGHPPRPFQSALQAPGVPQATQPARGEGRGGGRGARGGAQAARGGGQPAAGSPRDMARTRATSSTAQQPNPLAAAPIRGRGRGRARGRGQGRAQPRAAFPPKEPQVDFEEEVPSPAVPRGPAQVPEGFIATPVL